MENEQSSYYKEGIVTHICYLFRFIGKFMVLVYWLF